MSRSKNNFGHFWMYLSRQSLALTLDLGNHEHVTHFCQTQTYFLSRRYDDNNDNHNNYQESYARHQE